MRLINRELSWLAFNERVLQEALDETNPLVERMRFLGIYSNNMDEFFRVRVAYLQRMVQLGATSVQGFKGTPAELFDEIRNIVLKQQRKMQLAYKKILNALEKQNIIHITEEQLNEAQTAELKDYFNRQLKHAIVPIILDKATPFPRLKDSGIYLAVKMEWDQREKRRYALIKIPTAFSRFYRMSGNDKEYVILLDDIIRLNLDAIFSIFHYDRISAYTFKFTRDAELDIDDDITVSLMEKIEKSIKKRKKGVPVRFVYDEHMPSDLLDYLLKELKMKYGLNTIPGGKYHNFKDFMSFPSFERPEFVYKKRTPNNHPVLEGKRSLIKTIMKQDVLLHFPYQRFDYIVDLLREAAIDPRVKAIKINVYRVAKNSQVMNALMNAVMNGKEVTVIIELQARFDEENNLSWATKLQEGGAKVFFGIEQLKVHSKLIQIYRESTNGPTWITYLGTGNFNESTATIYEDLGLLTTDQNLGREVEKVFKHLTGEKIDFVFKDLIVSPFNSRKRITQLIRTEIRNKKKGKPAGIKIKLNNLVDPEMIELLYEASAAGVQIELMVRGVCCLIQSDKKLSEHITARSIVGRYLEHSRIMIFENGGDPLYFLTSGDWMERNLDRRIEVGGQVKDAKLKSEIARIFETMWKGNVKSRVLDRTMRNRYYRNNEPVFNAQDELFAHYTEISH
jgi:polyphosphate kinase